MTTEQQNAYDQFQDLHANYMAWRKIHPPVETPTIDAMDELCLSFEKMRNALDKLGVSNTNDLTIGEVSLLLAMTSKI